VPMTTQLLRWALDGVRPTRSTLLTAALALLGVGVVSGVFFAAGSADGSTLFGDTVALLGTIGWIVYTRGAARFVELDVMEYTALTVLASWPLLLVGALVAGLLGLSSAPGEGELLVSWHALLYVGLVSSAISVLAFNHGVRTVGALTATAFLNFVPVSALLMSIALGKPPSANELVGMAIVIGALLLHTAAASRAGDSSARKPASVPRPQPAQRAQPNCRVG
jgi:drug/metabolite transporter (DMT)-like permease